MIIDFVNILYYYVKILFQKINSKSPYAVSLQFIEVFVLFKYLFAQFSCHLSVWNNVLNANLLNILGTEVVPVDLRYVEKTNFLLCFCFHLAFFGHYLVVCQ